MPAAALRQDLCVSLTAWSVSLTFGASPFCRPFCLSCLRSDTEVQGRCSSEVNDASKGGANVV